MSGVYKRKTDKARGKVGKWTCWWLGEDGKKKSGPGVTDKAKSIEIAQHREAEARRVREGIIDPGERARREHAAKPLTEHVEDYRLELAAKGDTPKHATHIKGAVERVLTNAAIASVADLAVDRIRGALARLKAKRSARTANHALAALKAFARWLEHANRIKEVPRGLLAIKPYPEEGDRKRVRRALTAVELDRLLLAAEVGPTIVSTRAGRGGKVTGELTGPERAILYRIAMATGFRADEIRTLTPERFHLEGDSPSITVLACYSKRGKRSGRDDVQPVRRDVAEALKAWVATRPPGVPVLPVPEKTAKMLRGDLKASGIAYADDRGRVVDFHALRHSYITGLVRAGVNPKIVQKLARHSTITLTLDRYTHVEDSDVRGALEAHS